MRRQHNFVLTMEELEQELCDHVLGHVFALTYDHGCCNDTPFFFQVMGWHALRPRPVIPTRVSVWARPLHSCQAQPLRPAWRTLCEADPRPSEPSRLPAAGWLPCSIFHTLDPDTGQARHTLCHDSHMYRPRSEWMLPNYVFKLTPSGIYL